jgi:hypothetical protein
MRRQAVPWLLWLLWLLWLVVLLLRTRIVCAGLRASIPVYVSKVMP